MNSFERYLSEKRLAKTTIKWYNICALEFITWLDRDNTDPDNTTAGDITGYLSHLKQRGLANISRRNQLIAIRHYLSWRVEQGARQDNPAQHIKIRGIKYKTLYPLLSIQELEKMYQAYKVPEENDLRQNRNWYAYYRLSRQRNKAILGLMIWQGLTTPEVNRLSVNDLKLREEAIYIAGSRSSNERTLELRPVQVMELMEYQLQTRKELLAYLPGITDKLFLPNPAAGSKTVQASDTVHIWKRLGAELKKQHSSSSTSYRCAAASLRTG